MCPPETHIPIKSHTILIQNRRIQFQGGKRIHQDGWILEEIGGHTILIQNRRIQFPKKMGVTRDFTISKQNREPSGISQFPYRIYTPRDVRNFGGNRGTMGTEQKTCDVSVSLDKEAWVFTETWKWHASTLTRRLVGGTLLGFWRGGVPGHIRSIWRLTTGSSLLRTQRRGGTRGQSTPTGWRGARPIVPS